MNKKIIFLLIFIILFIKNVNAETKYSKVYLDNYVINAYVNKVNGDTIYYSQSRIAKTRNEDRHVYCLDPFSTINTEKSYIEYDQKYTLLNITESMWKRISLLAYYGYGYMDHTSDIWYSITQVMIWQTLNKNNEFYFTDSLNGAKTNKYDMKINELNNLVKNHYLMPSFSNKNFIVSINTKFILKDKNNVISKYKIINNNNSIIDDSNLIINVGNKNDTVTFVRNFKLYNQKPMILMATETQNLLIPGDVDSLNSNISVEPKSGKIKIIKKDLDTNSIKTSGEGFLIGSKYGLYDEKDNLISTMFIDENNESIIDNLSFGKYYIKEIESMEGYKLDKSKYAVTIDENNLEKILELKNQAISSKIVLFKYIDGNMPEFDISFNIYNKNDEFIKQIKTDINGMATFELYYGNYTVKQQNSTKNYLKVNNFEIHVTNSDEQKIVLYDKKYSSRIKIIKKDKETNKPINDETVFKIFDLKSKKYILNNKSEYFILKNGFLITEPLFAGEYRLEEVKAPIGYKIANKNTEFIIDDENHLINNTFEVIVYNEKHNKITVDVPNTYSENKNKQKIFIFITILFAYIIKKYKINILFDILK